LIPGILFIRLGRKNHFRIFWRKKIRIGLDKDSHVLINLPLLKKSPITLGATDPKHPGFPQSRKRFLLPFAFQTAKSDGLSVFLVSPRHLPLAGIFACLLLVLIISSYVFPPRTPIRNQDWNLIPLPAASAYGFCRIDRTHPFGVRFGFSGTENQISQIAFTAGRGEILSTLGISLNGVAFLDGIRMPEGWGEEMILSLPPNRIKTGPNEVEFKILKSVEENILWGIRNVRLLRKDPANQMAESHESILEDAQNIINRPSRRPIDLARCYERVESIPENQTGKDILPEKERIKNELEKQMEKTIKEVVIRAKSRRLMGDNDAARLLIDEARNWIPGGWPKGREILNGFLP